MADNPNILDFSGGGGDFILIESQTVSAPVANIDFVLTDTHLSTFSFFKLFGFNIRLNSGGQNFLLMNFSIDAGQNFDSSAVYSQAIASVNQNGNFQNFGNNSQTAFKFSQDYVQSNDSVGSFDMNMHNFNESGGLRTCQGLSGVSQNIGGVSYAPFNGIYSGNLNDIVNAFRISDEDALNFLSGTFNLYGIT